MNKLLPILTIGIALAFGAAHAEDKVKAKTPQQEKMSMCNKDAEGKKGDERKAFMKTCLSAKPVTQQSKMKTCNVDAGDKKGDERKAFMSECLKNKS
ncbi:MAG: PsiF family protein [Burkholderiaceae bacterium]